VAVTQAFIDFTGPGIFKDNTGAQNIDHEISIVGWGVDSATNTPYWILRNSWYHHFIFSSAIHLFCSAMMDVFFFLLCCDISRINTKGDFLGR
jgi:hypothetical protein